MWLMPILAIWYFLFGTTYSMNIPLKDGLMKEHRLKSRELLTYALLPLCILVSGVVAYVLAMALGANDFIGSIILVPVLISPLVSIGLFAMLSLRRQKFIHVQQFDGTYATISGVHPYYLSELPSWFDR
jgi:hypothetical protein